MAPDGQPVAEQSEPRVRHAIRWTLAALAAGTAGAVLVVWNSAPGSAAASPAGRAVTDRVALVGMIDADSGTPGTFTGKDGWPAVSPHDFKVAAGATVVLTIMEYDDMATALPDGSPFLSVIGGTETVDGKPVTSIGQDKIAHTFTIPELGINIPLPTAPDGGFTTVRFTFKAPTTPGTYAWLCETPCGGDPNGVGGAMQTDGWMRGHIVVG